MPVYRLSSQIRRDSPSVIWFSLCRGETPLGTLLRQPAGDSEEEEESKEQEEKKGIGTRIRVREEEKRRKEKKEGKGGGEEVREGAERKGSRRSGDQALVR